LVVGSVGLGRGGLGHLPGNGLLEGGQALNIVYKWYDLGFGISCDCGHEFTVSSENINAYEHFTCPACGQPFYYMIDLVQLER